MTSHAEVGVLEAKTRLSELLRSVEAGDEVVVTRGGRAVARIVGVTAGGVDGDQAEQAPARFGSRASCRTPASGKTRTAIPALCTGSPVCWRAARSARPDWPSSW